jgi:DNA-binding transcriptional regulator PaaX
MTTHSTQKYRRGELAKEILFMIAAGIVIPAAFVLPNLPIVLKPLLKDLARERKTGGHNFVKSLTYLKKNRLVSVIEKDGEQILSLTEEGKRRILRFDIDNVSLKKPKRWDGLWRIVIFDVPEEEREARDALRNKLQNLGFYQMQKSCFVHPFDCKDEIDFVTEIFHVSHHVNFIVAKSIEGANYLKKFFDL